MTVPSYTPRLLRRRVRARLLLDTGMFLWWQAHDPRLGLDAKQIIASAELAFVSVVTVWELAEKQAAGKVSLPGDVADAIETAGFELLPLLPAHVLAAAPPSGDTFDRLLAAQARADGLTLLTADARFAAEPGLRVALLKPDRQGRPTLQYQNPSSRMRAQS